MAKKATNEAEVVRLSDTVVSSVALEAQERAAIDVQIATAKRYPRVLSQVQDRILELATLDRETAENCWYALPRGGKVIEGPSVRLAEIVASSYRNLRMASRVIGIDDQFVTCQGACHDLENNVAVVTEVKRRITKKNGKRYDDDMVMVTANAANSIAFRNAIFKVVPMALFKSVVEDVRKVGMGDERTMAQTRDAALAYFSGLDIPQDRVLGLLGKNARDDLTRQDIGTLRGMATAIREGTSTVEEMFPVASNSGKLAAGRHKIESSTAEKAEKPRGEKEAKPKAESKATNGDASVVGPSDAAHGLVHELAWGPVGVIGVNELDLRLELRPFVPLCQYHRILLVFSWPFVPALGFIA